MADLPSNNPPFHQFPLHCYYYYHHLPSFPYPDATVFIPTPHPQGFILPPTYQYGYCAYASVLPMPMTPPYPYPPTSAAPAPLFGYPPYDYLPYFPPPPPPPSKQGEGGAAAAKQREGFPQSTRTETWDGCVSLSIHQP
ncbi:uncharacterized protein G2W53_043341 [Senna tora]|uniref:Uncharacterized protein n=1 Tax=Senna tora TaxID=362788 RepID=A0A834W0I5_9FABA|nr:uncharacterized protein G2W53_043341 [Senna tora]